MYDCSEELVTEVELVPLAEDNLDPLWDTAREDDVTSGSKDVLVDEELACTELHLSLRALIEEEEGGFSPSRCFIEERAVTQGECRQIRDDRLEVEERFKATLRNLCLIGSIGCVPDGILQYITLDDGGEYGIVPALADVGGIDFVLRCKVCDMLSKLPLSHRLGEIQRLVQSDVGG